MRDLLRTALASAVGLLPHCGFDPDATQVNPDGGPAQGDGGPPGGIYPDGGLFPNCGNGVLDGDEQCDDGGRQAGDGCSPRCTVEPGWRCPPVPGPCARLPGIAIIGSRVGEGEPLRFVISLSSTISAPILLPWDILPGGTAQAGDDFHPRSGTATIAAGEAGTVLRLTTNDDLLFEPPETVKVVLPTAVELGVMPPTATGTIGPPRLTDRGAVVRYFLDEQSSSPPASSALDAINPATLAVDLMPILSATGPVYETRGAGRGVAWSALTSAGSVGANVGATKVQFRLNGTQRFTLEIFVELQSANTRTRVLHLGRDDDVDALAVIFSGSKIELERAPDFGLGLWKTSVVGRGPTLVTVTVDSTDPRPPADRATLYLNGERQAAPSYPPQANDTLVVGNQDRLVIGNASRGRRSLIGWIGYVAVYDVELAPDEVKRNADRIRVDDDRRRIR